MYTVQPGDNKQGGWDDRGVEGSKATLTRERDFLQAELSKGSFVKTFFHYYVKGRAWEWAMGLSMLFTGIELLVWDDVVSFGAFHWMLKIISQKWIGTLLLFIGWLRVSSLMFNGQLLFGRRLGYGIRAICAVMAASLWAQFAFALFVNSFTNGVPSIGLPFWIMFTITELVVAYSVGEEWKR